MRYQDAIYGGVDITEPVLLELMASDAMQRLRSIYQHGITALLGITAPFSRFDHCVGAMLLVRRLGADLDEQIAALLHDVSHTAFSHVIDFVFDAHMEQDYHGANKEAFVAGSDLPGVLARHGRHWRNFLDERPFQLLEQPAPALCADRLDYFLRDIEFMGLATRGETLAAVHALTVWGQQIAVDNIDTARWLAYTFMETDRGSWSDFREVGLYQVTAQAIRQALHHGIVGETDLWGTDARLWHKLRSSGHPPVRKLVELISPGTRFTWAHENPSFTVTTKVRTIDPHVIQEDGVAALSELDARFRSDRDRYLKRKQGPWPMRIIHPPAPTPD